ncbi:HAD family hydrolase [Brachybacterium phenoliresistens]|uniref:HAD family hydrolase n=1 Tax=Brachybacterium phenoliresistens TaxID=396014 RepID=Z9JQ09_9MICO|nr:HAD family hydrolase [Brachybacterium phenoliresistens]EWS79847.1 HAD family hydrolase [Brachybacterium phenoliresistens]
MNTAIAAPGALDEIRAALNEALAPLQDGTVLLGLDVDGTLVDHDGHMSEPVHAALTAAAREHHVVIATGRSIGATLPVVRTAGVERGFAVCSNGAVTLALDPEAEDGYRVLDVRTFRPQQALRALREVAPGAHYAVEMADGRFRATPDFQDASFGVEAEETDLDELLDLEAVRVVVHVPDLTPQEFSRIIADAGVHGVEYAIGWTAWLDMAAPGVSKASALELVRERLEIPSERTVAVGDGWNDTEMLAWAGVGVAMGQAPQGVADIADLRTADVAHDGVALVLRGVTPA